MEGVLGAAREPREQQRREQEEEGAKGAGGGPAADRKGAGAVAGGGMKFRVSARAPHGVGALLLIGGAAVVGAAVLAWRTSRRGKKGTDRRQPAKDKVLDGGVVEDGKAQDGTLVQKLDQSNENLSVGNTEIGSVKLDGKATEESHQIHKDNEIVVVAEQLDTRPEEKIDQSSGRNPVEVSMVDTDKEHVEKIGQNLSRNHVEITPHDMCQDNEQIDKRIDQNLSGDPVEIVTPEVITVCLAPRKVEKIDEDSSKNNIEKEIAPKDIEDVKASDQNKLSIGRPGIIFSKNNDESDGVQEAESMENTPTAQLMMHQELLDDMVTDTVTEAEEGKQAEKTITDEEERDRDEKKALTGLAELVSSPAVPSLVKPVAEKKGPELHGLNEVGMKTEQDYTNGEIRKHDLLINKRGLQGGAIATMDRRSPALAILALIFAMTIGITVIVRLYAPTRATKLQMDL